MMSGSIVGAYLPDYTQQANPDQSTVFAGESSIVGVCGFLASVYIGVLCERLFARIPAISLYTTSIGSIAASVFMALAVYSAVIVQASDARYRLSLDGSCWFICLFIIGIACSSACSPPGHLSSHLRSCHSTFMLVQCKMHCTTISALH